MPSKDPADAKRAIAQAKKLNRQRSETAPLRPTPQQQQQSQRMPSSPRKEKSKHEGLGAKLGAFFNKLTLDSETSPRLRITTPSPRTSAAKLPFPKAPSSGSPLASTSLATLAEERHGGAHERSSSEDSSRMSPEYQGECSSSSSASSGEHHRVTHRQTVSHCQTSLGVIHTRLLHEQRKPSQNSQHSAVSANSATTTKAASTKSSSDRSSGASTLTNNTRKRSFTHLGLSMEFLPSSSSSEQQPQAVNGGGPQLRRAKPTTNITTFHAKLTNANALSPHSVVAPTNSLGLVLQSSSTTSATVAQTKPLPMPARSQRHHNSLSIVHKEPKSPTAASARVNYGLSSIVSSRYATASAAAATASSPLSAKPASAFPPMPSDACQAAMLSGSASTQLSLVRGDQKDLYRRSQPKAAATAAASAVPPPVAKAFSDPTMDSAIASMLVIATSTYDYSSSIKGDLEFVRGERIIVQSKVNDDWWFGSILPESGRGSTGRSGMFPRSHVSFS
ncbi:hypothetical protein IWW38_004869 [Coemansia aciculifera]|uniref:Uncharacterized protein n=1 Tax=Coemansia aciculifera TaxID=417176 RepID=A0ACC1LY76_9FUNG|nr:hypothetical protein IWW38_004869 [Coemansia aciculifera]